MGPWEPSMGTGIGPLNFWQNFEWKNGMTLYCGTKTDNFRFGPHMGFLGAHMGPLGAHMGPWGPSIGTGIVPLNFWRNFEWKNCMTLYCGTKTDNFRFGPHMGPLGAHMGPHRGSDPNVMGTIETGSSIRFRKCPYHFCSSNGLRGSSDY